MALVGGQRWAAADRWAALCAALVILYNAWWQLRPAILELADVAPDPTLETKSGKSLDMCPEWLGWTSALYEKWVSATISTSMS